MLLPSIAASVTSINNSATVKKINFSLVCMIQKNWKQGEGYSEIAECKDDADD